MHGVNDARSVIVIMVGNKLDFIGEVFATRLGDARVEQNRASELKLIAAF